MGACNPIGAVGACGGGQKAGSAGACGPAAGGYGGGACGAGAVGGGGALIYNPQGVGTAMGMGGPGWGDVIKDYIPDPDNPAPPELIIHGDGRPNGTGPNFDYYLTGDPGQEKYDLIYDLNDPQVIDMLGGPERWSQRELTALGHSAKHKPADKQKLFFEGVADMVNSPEPLSLNDFYNMLVDRGYMNMSPEYRTTEVTAWWVWSQQGDSYNLPRG